MIYGLGNLFTTLRYKNKASDYNYVDIDGDISIKSDKKGNVKLTNSMTKFKKVHSATMTTMRNYS